MMNTVQAPGWMRIAISAQVVIAVFAVAISFFAALKIKPLLAQREDLKTQVSSLNAEVMKAQSELANYRKALNAAREGINQYHAGDYEAAVSSYDSALHLDPHNAYLLDLKGYSLFKQHKFEESVATLQQSVEASPTFAWGYFDLARTYCAMGKFSDARIAIQKAITIDSAFSGKMKTDGEFRRLCRPIVTKVMP